MEKLLAIISLGQGIYGRWLSRRLLYGAIVGVSLAVVTSAMIGAILIGGFYAAYQVLLHYGTQTQTAMEIVGGSAMLFTVLLAFITSRYLRRLRGMPRRLLQEKAPQISQAGDVLDAFLEGFLGQTK